MGKTEMMTALHAMNTGASVFGQSPNGDFSMGRSSGILAATTSLVNESARASNNGPSLAAKGPALNA